MKRLTRSLLMGCVLVAVASCAHQAPTAQAPAKGPPWLRLYPLEVGRSWTFRVQRVGVPGTTTSITRVASIEDHAVVLVSGDTTYRYVIRADGIWRPSQQAYLLKAPVREGATWPGALGGTVRITSTDATAEVPGGTYLHCVILVEDVPAAHLSQRHTFCPDVGPVRLEQFSDGVLIAKADLVAFGQILPGDS